MSKDYINKVYQDKYQVVKEIPGGEYEYAFMGKDLKSNKPVHIRIIPIDTDHPELMEQTQNFVFKEVSLLQRLRNPGLPVFIESLSTKEENVIITEFIDSVPLLEKLEEKPQLSEPEVIEFLGKLLPIMDYLHSQTPPVIYRDLQPKSIFIDKQGNLYLTKYEQARTFKAEKIKDTVIHASRGYSPPEQAFGKGQSDARSDIYSVGMIIFQMFTGKDPTKAPLILPKISDIRTDVSQGWSTIVSKATNIKVDKRYGSVKEVMKDLEKIQQGGDIAEDDRESPRKPAAEAARTEEPKKKIAMGPSVPHGEEKKPEPPAKNIKEPPPLPKTEPVKAEPVKAAPVKPEPPKPEPPKPETPKKAESVKQEAPKPETPKAQEQKKQEQKASEKKAPEPQPVKAQASKPETPASVYGEEEDREEPSVWAYFFMGLCGFLVILLFIFVVMGWTPHIIGTSLLFVIFAVLAYVLYTGNKDKQNSSKSHK